MRYIVGTCKTRKLFGWVGNKLDDLFPHLFADANHAGCFLTQRSTSGMYLCVRGSQTCFPISCSVKRQGSTALSTSDAETIAAQYALKIAGLPFLTLWKAVAIQAQQVLNFHEDNQAMIKLMKSGQNTHMRYLDRVHGVAIAVLPTHIRECSPATQAGNR